MDNEFKRLYAFRKTQPDIGDYVIIAGMPCQVVAKSITDQLWIRVYSLIIQKEYDLCFDNYELTIFTPLTSTQTVQSYSNGHVITDVETLDSDRPYETGDNVIVLAVPMCIRNWTTKKIISGAFRID